MTTVEIWVCKCCGSGEFSETGAVSAWRGVTVKANADGEPRSRGHEPVETDLGDFESDSYRCDGCGAQAFELRDLVRIAPPPLVPACAVTLPCGRRGTVDAVDDDGMVLVDGERYAADDLTAHEPHPGQTALPVPGVTAVSGEDVT